MNPLILKLAVPAVLVAAPSTIATTYVYWPESRPVESFSFGEDQPTLDCPLRDNQFPYPHYSAKEKRIICKYSEGRQEIPSTLQDHSEKEVDGYWTFTCMVKPSSNSYFCMSGNNDLVLTKRRDRASDSPYLYLTFKQITN
ncbi:hypothetical protein MHLP_02990 [Candidatus Mycoplasma haematolamae str. Purdue]|uniref:Uncharacterized protein n=1 Tax=Mycoplasma haematolamae (strain Purdue) TaxID=1212765 RepID=I7BJY4_MYCHA|nr:hypothetical protein [Candidatus Mycoplasma haematolamae]AFO52178.1 hypothetical protein MHLP_02990 [Candidatus Mycoplasma haematolamae str. Purdue]